MFEEKLKYWKKADETSVHFLRHPENCQRVKTHNLSIISVSTIAGTVESLARVFCV